MAEFLGSAAYLAWIYNGGTLGLNADFRTLNDQPSVNLINTRAGNDTANNYIVDTKDGQVAITLLAQTGGTAVMTYLQEGTGGTLLIGEEGTAVGKIKTTIPGISLGAQRNVQYNSMVEISVTIQQNGARTYGTWA